MMPAFIYFWMLRFIRRIPIHCLVNSVPHVLQIDPSVDSHFVALHGRRFRFGSIGKEKGDSRHEWTQHGMSLQITSTFCTHFLEK